MKLKNLIISLASGLGISVAVNAHAEVLQYLTFTVTTYTQRDSADNGTNTITAAPKVQTHNTAELLSILARDKAAQAPGRATAFPPGRNSPSAIIHLLSSPERMSWWTFRVS